MARIKCEAFGQGTINSSSVFSVSSVVKKIKDIKWKKKLGWLRRFYFWSLSL